MFQTADKSINRKMECLVNRIAALEGALRLAWVSVDTTTVATLVKCTDTVRPQSLTPGRTAE